MELAMLIFGALVIFIVGICIGKALMKIKSVGILRVNNSDSEGTYLFLELNSPDMTLITNRKYVTMKVESSHE